MRQLAPGPKPLSIEHRTPWNPKTPNPETMTSPTREREWEQLWRAVAVPVIVTARSEATQHEVKSRRKTLVDAKQPSVGPIRRWQQKQWGAGGRRVGAMSVAIATTEARRRRPGQQQQPDSKPEAKILLISPRLALKMGPFAWRPGGWSLGPKLVIISKLFKAWLYVWLDACWFMTLFEYIVEIWKWIGYWES